ncbi:MAG: DNA internalization-related competence protein ComEC/Rec2 [Idiomarina sp.]|nr:DNA internalization-related competence protein ComEC/Rec2 [Idiomarina sp.]
MDGWFLGALLGTLLSPWLPPSWPLWPFVGLTLGVGFLLYLMTRRSPCGERNSTDSHLSMIRRIVLLFCIGVLCGMQWSLINAKVALSWNLPEHLHRQSLALPMRIDSIVDDNGFRWRFDARLEPNEASAIQQPIKVRLQWYGAEGERPQLGELWLAEVRLRPPVSQLNQVGFNYQAALLRQGIKATGYITTAELIEPARGGRANFSQFRQYLYNQYSARRTDLIHGDILLALSMAERGWISREDWTLLQHTGVAHLMAISGLHLSMVFATSFVVLRWLLSWLSRLWTAPRRPFILPVAWLAAWCCACFYAALAGFSVATLRALLLISLFLLMRISGLHSTPIRTLLRAVVLVLVFDPLAFLDPGFWLSCVAVFSIFVWLWRLPTQPRPGWISHLHQLWRLEVMLTLVLVPLSVIYFAGVSVIAPLTNLLAVPVFSLVVLPLALISVVLLPLHPVLASALLHTADTVLQWLWGLLTWLQPWSFLPTMNAAGALMALLIVLVFYLPVSLRHRCSAGAAILMSVVLLLVVQPTLRSQDPRLWLHMLDVGQGSALVVERGGRALMIDSGPAYQDFNLAGSLLIPFLQARELRPDVLVLTHPHWDHIGGAAELIHHYPAMSVIDTNGDYLPCTWGMPWHWQGAQVHILAPTGHAFYGVNNHSCVVQLRYQGQVVLLPGDIERLGEFRLVRSYGDRLRSDVLLVPHHGSRTSSHRYFLQRVQPRWALISSGYLNRFNQPHAESLQRLAETEARILNTANEGQVSLLWYRGAWHPMTARGYFSPYWFNQIR